MIMSIAVIIMIARPQMVIMSHLVISLQFAKFHLQLEPEDVTRTNGSNLEHLTHGSQLSMVQIVEGDVVLKKF